MYMFAQRSSHVEPHVSLPSWACVSGLSRPSASMSRRSNPSSSSRDIVASSRGFDLRVEDVAVQGDEVADSLILRLAGAPDSRVALQVHVDVVAALGDDYNVRLLAPRVNCQSWTAHLDTELLSVHVDAAE